MSTVITKVLVDSNNKIVSVVNYDIDPSVLLEGLMLRIVRWDTDEPIDVTSLPGKVWIETGTFENATPVYDWDIIRELRDAQLVDTDWTQVTDCPLSAEKIQEFAIWRNALRNLPQLFENPSDAYDEYEELLNAKP